MIARCHSVISSGGEDAYGHGVLLNFARWRWSSASEGFVLPVAIICLRYYLKSARTHYQITNQRIKLERGLLSKLQESLELFRIDHFELRKPLGMRLVSTTYAAGAAAAM